MSIRQALTGWAIAAGIASAATAAMAQETNLKVAMVFPQTHWHFTYGLDPFMKEAERLSGGNLKFESYPAGQLGKETTMLVTSGLAEIGLLVPSYETDKLPLTSVTELPGFHSNSCEGTRKLWEMSKEGGPLYEAEYKQLGVRPLYAVLMGPYQMTSATKKVTSLDELKGLKVRANGAAMEKAIRALGAIPVKVTTTELYDALSRGTVDGAFWPIGSTKMQGLENLIKYTVAGPQLGAGATVFAISEKAWQKLDPEAQQALAQAGETTMASLCQHLDEDDARVTKELVDEGLLEVTRLSPEQEAAWAERIATVGDEWAKEMNSTGRPGTELLEAYRALPTQ